MDCCLKRQEATHNYIITLVDYFPKWPEAEALPDKTAKSVSMFLLKTINVQVRLQISLFSMYMSVDSLDL